VIVLGIDTATTIASVGIVSSQRPDVQRADGSARHAAMLLRLIEEALGAAGARLSDLDRLAVSIGPGSFTGLRVGLSIAKGLAVAAKIPVVGVPTLAAYARAVGPRHGMVVPVLDARKGEVYAAAYRWQDGELVSVFGPQAFTPDDLARRLDEPATLVGDGVDAYAELWARIPAVVASLRLADCPPSGAVIARMGAETPPRPIAELEPQYCRLPAAAADRAGPATLSIG